MVKLSRKLDMSLGFRKDVQAGDVVISIRWYLKPCEESKRHVCFIKAHVL